MIKSADSAPVPLPTVRTGLFDPPAELARIRRQEPLCRLAYPDGQTGWLVTGYSIARKVLADPRFGRLPLGQQRSPVDQSQLQAVVARLEAEHHPLICGLRAGDPSQLNPPSHTRIRRSIGRYLTSRQVGEFRSSIERIVGDRIDAMEQVGSPVNFVKTFAAPVVSRVLYEFVGIPDADHHVIDNFLGPTENSLDDVGVDDVAQTWRLYGELICKVVRQNRVNPTPGLLGQLAVQGALTEEEMVGIASMMAGGSPGPISMLASGTFALLHDRSQWEAIRADPALVSNAVEELLRYLTVNQLGFNPRRALEDVQVGHLRIKKDEWVHVSAPAVKRDPAAFGNPDVLDLRRDTRGHLSFGHGIHTCPASISQEPYCRSALAGWFIDSQHCTSQSRPQMYPCLPEPLPSTVQPGSPLAGSRSMKPLQVAEH